MGVASKKSSGAGLTAFSNHDQMLIVSAEKTGTNCRNGGKID